MYFSKIVFFLLEYIEMKQTHGLLILAMTCLLLPANGHAGEWGLGLGVAAQRPPQQGTDTQVVVLPFPSYEGERLSLDFGSIGYALATSERIRFAVEGQLRFDGYDPNESAALAGLEERDLTLDVGVSLTVGDAWGIASFKIMGDALGVHNGYEISGSYLYPLQFKRLTIMPSIGVKMPSAELVEYYYGVRTAEATESRPVYSGKSVVNGFVSVNLMYELADSWEIIGGAQYVRLGSGISDSPIIERDSETLAYSAIVFRF